MDMDLSQALHDAARAGTAHRGSISPGPVLQRIHRRRQVRVALESTVGAAAVGVVAVGAVQVNAMRDVEPARPAITSLTPTPDAGSAPPAVTAAAGFECGLPLPAIVDPAGDADLRFEPALVAGGSADGPGRSSADAAGATLTRGQHLTVVADLVNGTSSSIEVVATGAARVWFTQGAGVVGVLSVENAEPVTEYSGGPGATIVGERPAGVPIACTPDAQGATSLPAGAYDVYVVQELRLSDDVTALVTSAPSPVTITEDAVDGESPADPPTTSPTGDGHPDLGDLVISTTGLGPLTVGVPPSGNPGAAMIERDPDFCDPEVYPGTDPARWVASGYPTDDVLGEPKAAFFVDADDTAVRRIDVLGPTIRTAEGIGNGSTVAELHAAYPQLEGPFDGGLSRVWWLTGPTGTLVLETQARDELGNPSSSEPERVILMRVLAAGIDPAFAAANSDNIAGGCL